MLHNKPKLDSDPILKCKNLSLNQREIENRGESMRSRGRDLELEGERREDDSAFLLENFADIVTGGGCERQANRLPHYPIFLSNRPNEKAPPTKKKKKKLMKKLIFQILQ